AWRADPVVLRGQHGLWLLVDAPPWQHRPRAACGRGVVTMAALLEQPVFLVLALMFGVGVFLAIAGPSIGVVRPNLVVRLRRLDPDVWWDEPAPETDAGAFFRPLGEDIARLAGRVLASLGLIPPHELPRALAQAESSMRV